MLARYAYAWEPVLHLPVTLRTRRYCFLSWESLLARLFTGEPETALTSDPAYPAILIPGLFGPERAC